MKLLIPHHCYHPYFRNLLPGIPEEVDITFGYSEFWNPRAKADVLAIHWPEEIASRKFIRAPITAPEVQIFKEQLERWADKTVVVAFVHNLLPHDRQNESLYRLCYEAVYENSSVLVHHGESSIAMLKEAFPVTATKEHTVIPSVGFFDVPSQLSQADARARLGLDSGDFVVAVVGHIRHREELTLVTECFEKARIPNKRLVIASAIYPFGVIFDRAFALISRVKKWTVWNRLLEEQEMQLPLCACDVVLVPRITTLNSGVVVLAATFGRVSVGPRYGVVGEILDAGMGFSFAPEDKSHGAAKMLELAATSDLKSMGHWIQKEVESKWSSHKVGSQHYLLLKRLSQRRPSQSI